MTSPVPATARPATAAPAPPQPARSVVLDAWPETEAVRGLRLARPPGFDLRAGGVVKLVLDTPTGREARTLTPANAPDADHLEVYTAIGGSPFKRAFAALAPGDAVGVLGPFNKMTLDTARPGVFHAFGLGAVTAASLVRHARAVAPDLAATVVHVAPLPAYEPLAGALAGTGARIVRATATDAATIREVSPPDAAHYVSGPPAFVDEVLTVLKHQGVPDARVQTQRFMGY